MQVWITDTTLTNCAANLDARRLRSQISEITTMLKTITGESAGWGFHPAVQMYAKYEMFLRVYRNACIIEMRKRGLNISREPEPVEKPEIPPFLGWRLINSHRANLVAKAPEHYQSMWPDVQPDRVRLYFVNGEWVQYGLPKPVPPPPPDATKQTEEYGALEIISTEADTLAPTKTVEDSIADEVFEETLLATQPTELDTPESKHRHSNGIVFTGTVETYTTKDTDGIVLPEPEKLPYVPPKKPRTPKPKPPKPTKTEVRKKTNEQKQK